ncbi:Wzz/FepE/Etk N-terminal domain-containing protein [Pseudomonas sp. NPDC089407]|uniref:Wzz/FepE/Etk N-terminal domain-containing protein n=1 Tax=Pseudomonas sp. NPDC089407 TaxID=3364464 RepID=UPI003850E4A8
MRNLPERLSSNEDVDLFQLIGWLWAQRLLIAVVTAIVALAALAYALLSTPVYQARVVVQPPSQDDISQVNIGRGEGAGLGRLSVKDVYAFYLGNLQSQALRRKFFREVYLPSLDEAQRQGSQDALYADFNKVLSIAAVSPLAPDRFYVAADLPDPKTAAQWVAQYAQMASDWTKRDLAKDLRADALATANNLERLISGAREAARNIREDQIVRLSEALKVARTIGLEKPPLISNTLATEVSAGMDGSLTYMRGVKALEAEIDNLRKRRSDDPFVRDLRERQETMSFYRDLQLNTEAVQVYRQDGAIEVPDRPIKPRKSLIVMLGVVTGLLLGVCLALYRGLRTARSRTV